MLTKTMPVLVKAVGTDDGLAEGEIEAIVAVFNNIDSYGDKIVPGAFSDDLLAWAQSGDPIPMYWSHRMDDPDFNIGEWTTYKEVAADELGYPHPAGLYMKGKLDLDNEAGKARQSYRLLKGRRVTMFSFAYDVLESGWVETKDDGYWYELRKLHVHEAGPTPVGANQETELLGVKAMTGALMAQVKSGRVLSAKNEESLVAARDAINAVLEAVQGEDSSDEEGKASTTTEAKTEEPSQAKAEELKPGVSVSTLLTRISIMERQ